MSGANSRIVAYYTGRGWCIRIATEGGGRTGRLAGWIEVATPLGALPLFARAGAIILASPFGGYSTNGG